MTAHRDISNGFSFAAEGMAGTAAAAALRRVRSLADQAPSGRLFAAIATLTEMSKRIETSLETGEYTRAVDGMNLLAAKAQASEPNALANPRYLKKRL